MASHPKHSTSHAQSKSNGSAAHPGTPVENEHYQFEWTTSECEDTGNLIDELRIISNEDDATLLEPYTYYTHLQDHTPSRKRRVVHPADRILRDQATTASATASCESLALQSTSSSTGKPEQYDFFQTYERNWDTRSITDCESVEVLPLPELERVDSGYESFIEDEKMGLSLRSPSTSPARSATFSEASTVVVTPRKTLSDADDTNNRVRQESLWHTHVPARDSLELDRNGLRLCDGERISMASNNSFEVLEARLPRDCWIPHRNSMDLDRNGNRLCATRGSAPDCEKDKAPTNNKLKAGWLKLKAKLCKKCEEERIRKRVMVNYL
ncbi:hypothetical protein Slin15195_G076470 [Septoria linicola]|uniref:Uncharacterized protein n=1 Tax=Septoria linicola TaxID=215465 RepID=A0A9Q9AYE5_9PEZI|nr:hypothetical protein Slin15195_G076470 [Septoria linicola]